MTDFVRHLRSITKFDVSEIEFYQSSDGQTEVQVTFDDDTVCNAPLKRDH
jgi:hypothetical protein